MQSRLNVTLPAPLANVDPADAATPPRAVGLQPPANMLGAFDRLYIRSPRRWLALVLIAYLLVACLFATQTPAWQAPDEPAHYNYIAHIATTLALPVLHAGDYDQAQLDRLLATQFAPKLPTSGLRYESYQPPLYYLLMTPVFWATGGDLLALRLANVVLGMGTILLLYLCLELVFPGKTLIPLGAASFAALLPMHVAMSAAVNNDGLAELLLMAAMLVLLHWLRNRFYAPRPGATTAARQTTPEMTLPLLLLGLLLGLGMLTKIYAYMLLPVVVMTIIVTSWLQPRHGADEVRMRPSRAGFVAGLRLMLWTVIPACLLALPLWVRNSLLYGTGDWLALRWHDRVVIGQARTGEWIAHNGWIAYGERAFGFTFRSFWGVFGWMGVFMDERIYTVLLLFTGIIFLGVLWATVRFISGGPDTDMDGFQLSVLILFGVMLLVVGVSYLGYNYKFVQHQGRYFFWGLLPISTVVALGWREVLQPLQGAITGGMALVLAAATAIAGLFTVTGELEKWTLLAMILIALLLLFQPLLLGGTNAHTLRWLPPRLKRRMAQPPVAGLLGAARGVAWALPFVLLFLLDLAIPRLFIVPQLGG